ncbi:hypothetical protein CIHG_02631 [Coccidioides immitis H538.4]|uniref:Uncharacterized protein n=3 Tax=Coccidioides immitis TaxID=5501 RepID=A0A0J8R741_COCIT|nr:hypothetical protein CIRG_02957 [Coccidioides immitis RMSCC 2394]KMU80255.1 hypothetical protein CISG_08361 [Coccidioides immitis RMSCC 3703]KMU84847.1 hypothetical protein CIHG_02631 [Coccidioides immitis H538.4]
MEDSTYNNGSSFQHIATIDPLVGERQDSAAETHTGLTQRDVVHTRSLRMTPGTAAKQAAVQEPNACSSDFDARLYEKKGNTSQRVEPQVRILAPGYAAGYITDAVYANRTSSFFARRNAFHVSVH